MRSPVFHFLGAWFVLTTVAFAASAPAIAPSRSAAAPTASAGYDTIISLPEFVVREGRNAPRCFYGEVPGIQILSLCSEKETRDFVHDLQVQRFLLEQLLPAELRVSNSVPLLVFLKPRLAGGDVGTRLANVTAGAPPTIGPSIAGMSTLVLNDLDASAVLRTFQPLPSGRGMAVPLPPAYPIGDVLGSVTSLPGWARNEVTVLFNQLSVVQDSLQLRLASQRLDPSFAPSIGEFFSSGANASGSGGTDVPPPPVSDVAARSAATLHMAFIRWVFSGGKARIDAYWMFVRRAAAEPAYEAMFQECFGVGYLAVMEQLRRTSATSVAGPATTTKIATAKPPTFPPITLRAPTKPELTRTKNEWKRLVASWPGGVRFGITPELRKQALDEVVRDLEAAYAQGERDPQLLAELALAECDAGRDEPAVRYLEAAAETRLARPRIYYELARLRFQAVKAAAGASGTFDAAQVASIMEPLSAAHGLIPALREAFLLMVDTLSRASAAPSSRQLEMLDEGLRQFPGRAEVARRVGDLKRRAESPSEGLAEVPNFFPDLLEADQRARTAARQSIASRAARLPTGVLRSAPGSIQIRAIPPADAYHPPRTGDFVFQLMPKSLQLRPLLDMTVATQFTDYGRLIRPATPQDPVYYVAQSGGFHQLGDQIGGEKSPPADRLEATMKSALAANGYLAADASNGKSPSLAVIFSWGSQNKPAPDELPNLRAIREGMQQRRALVYGGLSSPMDWDKRQEFSEQVNDDLYFVVASAYDYNQLALGNKKLVWRTNMTVSSRGVAMTESLPPLIASAAPFFGREMSEPELISRKISRTGRVEIGPLRTVGDAQKSPELVPAEPAPTKP